MFHSSAERRGTGIKCFPRQVRMYPAVPIVNLSLIIKSSMSRSFSSLESVANFVGSKSSLAHCSRVVLTLRHKATFVSHYSNTGTLDKHSNPRRRRQSLSLGRFQWRFELMQS